MGMAIVANYDHSIDTAIICDGCGGLMHEPQKIKCGHEDCVIKFLWFAHNLIACKGAGEAFFEMSDSSQQIPFSCVCVDCQFNKRYGAWLN